MPKPGLYETDYGNTCRYTKGRMAYDIDAAERIPIEMVDFSKPIVKEPKPEDKPDNSRRRP